MEVEPRVLRTIKFYHTYFNNFTLSCNYLKTFRELKIFHNSDNCVCFANQFKCLFAKNYDYKSYTTSYSGNFLHTNK